MMKQRSIDIFVVVALAIIATGLVFVLPSDSVAGRILALPLVFVLPGYALTVALLSEQFLDIPKRIVFSLGISLAIVVVGGLLLNLTPVGLRANSWAIYLCAITLVAGGIGLLRRQRGGVAASSGSPASHIRFTFRQGLLLGLAALIVCAAFVVSIVGAQQQPYPGFTQLWLLRAAGSNAENVVNLGVSNMESKAMEYRLAVNVNGKLVKEWSSIDLNVGEKWDTTLVFPLSNVGGSTKVEADLYRANAPTKIYRYVVLWLSS